MLFRINDSLALEAGVDLRRRGRALRADDPAPAGLPRPPALPLPDRDRGILLLLAPGCRASGRRSTAPTSGSTSARSSFQPAEFAKICIVVFLASYLREKRELLTVGARRVAGVTIPPLKHFGPAARGLGRDDDHARLHPRPRQLADVLRRLPGAALRGDGAALVRDRRPGALLRRRLVDRLADRPRPATASTSGSTPCTSTRRRAPGQIQQSLFAQADGGLFGQGLGESLLSSRAVRAPLRAAVPGLRQHPAGAAHRHDLRADRQRARPLRRLRADRRSTR